MNSNRKIKTLELKTSMPNLTPKELYVLTKGIKGKRKTNGN